MEIEVIKNDLFKHRRDKDGKIIKERKRFYKDLYKGVGITPKYYKVKKANFLKTKKEYEIAKKANEITQKEHEIDEKEYENLKKAHEIAKKTYEITKKEFEDIVEKYFYKDGTECEEPTYKHGLCIGSVGLAMSYKNDELCAFINTLSSTNDEPSAIKECKKIEEEYLNKAMEHHLSYNDIKKGKLKTEGFQHFFLNYLKLGNEHFNGPLNKSFKEIQEDFKTRAKESNVRLGFAIFTFNVPGSGHVVYLVKYDNSIAFFEPASGVIKAEISNVNTEDGTNDGTEGDNDPISPFFELAEYKNILNDLKVTDMDKYDYYIHGY